MNDTQVNELEGIREKILNDVAPLAGENEDLDPAQRVELLMISAEAAEDPVPLISKAYEVAKTIENVGERANVLMDILNSVELFLTAPEEAATDTAASDNTTVAESPTAEAPVEDMPVESAPEAPAEQAEPTTEPTTEPTAEPVAEPEAEAPSEPASTGGDAQTIQIK